MTDTNEQAPATRSEWLALIREAVRLERDDELRERAERLGAIARGFAPQPPSEG